MQYLLTTVVLNYFSGFQFLDQKRNGAVNGRKANEDVCPSTINFLKKKNSNVSISAKMAWIGLLFDTESSLGYSVSLEPMLPMIEASMEVLCTFAKNG